MKSSTRLGVAVVAGLAVGILTPMGISTAQDSSQDRPTTPVEIKAPVPVPVDVEGGELVIGEDSATVPVVVEDLPLSVEGELALRESSEDRVTIRGINVTACDGECPAFPGALVSFADELPEDKHLLVETVTITWEISCGDFGTDPCPSDSTDFVGHAALQVSSPDFQRHFVGETHSVNPGFTGADAMATANLSFVSSSGVRAVVVFPDDRPKADRIRVTGHVAGRLIDAPTE